MSCRWLSILLLSALPCCWGQFRAGAARHDITPREPVPMWGYGARHDALSNGVLDPLYAEALVIDAAGKKLAIVGLDLGRSPAERSQQAIRKRIRDDAGIEFSFIAGSHTHHGPVLELSDEDGKGKAGSTLRSAITSSSKTPSSRPSMRPTENCSRSSSESVPSNSTVGTEPPPQK